MINDLENQRAMATKPISGLAPARAGRDVQHPRRFARRQRTRLNLEPLESRVVLSGTYTWTGLSDGISWDSGGNWAGGQVPKAGASVVFPLLTPRPIRRPRFPTRRSAPSFWRARMSAR